MRTPSIPTRVAALTTVAALLAWLVARDDSPLESAVATVADLETEPHSALRSVEVLSRERGGANDILVAAEPNPCPDTAAILPESARIRVVVRRRDPGSLFSLPEPELLRIDDAGGAQRVGPQPAQLHHPALSALRSTVAGTPPDRKTEVERTFAVDAPGRFAPAWYVWLQIPGTRTWRVRRGRGREISIAPGDPLREIVIQIDADSLRLDSSLDTRTPNARYRVTAKDGDSNIKTNDR